MTKENSTTEKNLFINEARIRHLVIVISLGFTLIIARILYLNLFDSPKILDELSKNQYFKHASLKPLRGNIYDHKKTPLAVSVKLPSVAINPRVFNPDEKTLIKFAKILNLQKDHVKDLGAKNSFFAWVKRKTTFQVVADLKKLNIKGVHIILESHRSYPNGHLASQLLGIVGTDSVGLMGLERQFELYLAREKTLRTSLKDARGTTLVLDPSNAKPIEPGFDLVLTIDQVLQDITEKELELGVLASQATGGFAVMLDPHTGKILAMANYPFFDPNRRDAKNFSHSKNQALSNIFEPGSIIKPFVFAAALEENLTHSKEIHNCTKNGVYEVSPSNFIHDDHPKELMTTEEVLVHSSNICTYFLAKKLGRQKLSSYYEAFGLVSKKALLKFPGESFGRISDFRSWSEIRFANIAFGQGFSINGLEVALAYSVIANGGRFVSPKLFENNLENSQLSQVESAPNLEQDYVIRPETAKALAQMLRTAVTEGTGRNADILEYEPAGKTGTAEKFDTTLGKYPEDKRIASFAGFAPYHDPHIVVVVVIDEPKKTPYYGGLWAAPVFREITRRSLQYLNVKPKSKPSELLTKLNK